MADRLKYCCSICNGPLRSIQFDETSQRPKMSFSREQCIDACEVGRWWDDIVLLCDPDDEFGTLEPSLQYGNLNMSWRELGPGGPASVQPLNSSTLQASSPSAEIEIHEGKYEEGSYFYLLNPPNPKSIVDCLRIENDPDRHTFDGRCYLPVHSVCLDMATKVWTSASNSFITNLRGLFLALRWRHAIYKKCGDSCAESATTSINFDLACNHYYAPRGYWWEWRSDRYYENSESDEDCGIEATEFEWEIPDEAENNFMEVLHVFGTSPYGIKDLTSTLLKNLEESKSNQIASAQASDFLDCLNSLPTEILHKIFSCVRTPRDLPQTTTGLLPQSFWREELLSGSHGLLPWLWDIDPKQVELKMSEATPSGDDFEWNWELLVRKLTRSVDFGVREDWYGETHPAKSCTVENGGNGWGPWSFTGYHNILVHVPMGLHNRRRIWQLLEEVFVGDTLPWPPERNASNYEVEYPVERFMRLHWNKSGQKLEAARWLPSIAFSTRFARQGFFRKLNGITQLVTSAGADTLLQYWQFDEDGRALEDQSATPEEVLKVLRRLEYPV